MLNEVSKIPTQSGKSRSAGKQIRPRPVAWALGSFLAISFVLCVLWDLIFPKEWQMYPYWQGFLPGFSWLSWGTFFLGFFESFLYGFYVSYVFIPLYNLFAKTASGEQA
jgi:hypothetical protein